MTLEVRVSDLLTRIKESKNVGESVRALEEMLVDAELIDDKKKHGGEQYTKIKRAHEILARTMTNELNQLANFLASELTDLENPNIDENCPTSHQHIVTIFNNTAYYIVNDIINSESQAVQVMRLQRWIAALKSSLDSHDYHTTAVINTALSHVAILRLKCSFLKLSREERELLHNTSKMIDHDQGWKIMQDHLVNGAPFIPNFSGIKKAFAKSREARNTHAMEAGYLTESGKLSTSGKLTESGKWPAPSILDT